MLRAIGGALLCLAIGAATAHVAKADSSGQDSCGDVLQKTDLSRINSSAQESAFLQLIDSDASLQEAKGLSGGLSALVDAIPISAQANYSAFSDWRTHYVQQTDSSYDSTEFNSLVTSFLSNNQVEAWSNCMTQGGDDGGAFLSVSEVRPTTVTVTFKYLPSRRVHQYVTLPRPGITGGHALESMNLPKKTDVEWVESIQFSRSTSTDFSMRWNIGSYNPHFIIPSDAPARVWQTHCVLPMVFAHMTNGTTQTYQCPGMKPGAGRVKADMNLALGFDGPYRVITVIANASFQGLNQNWRPPNQAGGLPVPYPLTWSTAYANVDDSGIATLTFGFGEADTDQSGVQTTISAKPGSTVTFTSY